jgi:hypothetical protein
VSAANLEIVKEGASKSIGDDQEYFQEMKIASDRTKEDPPPVVVVHKPQNSKPIGMKPLNLKGLAPP